MCAFSSLLFCEVVKLLSKMPTNAEIQKIGRRKNQIESTTTRVRPLFSQNTWNNGIIGKQVEVRDDVVDE